MSEAVSRLAWLACVVYSTIPSFWFMIHPFAAYWRTRKRNPFIVLVPAWMGFWVIVALLTSPWRQARLYITPYAWIPAAFLFVAGVWTYRQALRNFSSSQLGGLHEVRERGEQRLVTTGIRGRVRHPVYLGHLCEMVAWSVGSGLAVCYALTLFAIVTGAVMIRMEDAELEQRFGAEYQDYREHVRAVLPWV